MKINFSIIYSSEFGPQTLNGTVLYEPEPFCDRDDILTAVHRAVWSQLKTGLRVDEKSLDTAISACDNRLMEPPDLPEYPEHEYKRLNHTESGWRDYPDEYTGDEASDWLISHYSLRETDDYDPSDLIKQVLANEY